MQLYISSPLGLTLTLFPFHPRAVLHLEAVTLWPWTAEICHRFVMLALWNVVWGTWFHLTNNSFLGWYLFGTLVSRRMKPLPWVVWAPCFIIRATLLGVLVSLIMLPVQWVVGFICVGLWFKTNETPSVSGVGSLFYNACNPAWGTGFIAHATCPMSGRVYLFETLVSRQTKPLPWGVVAMWAPCFIIVQPCLGHWFHWSCYLSNEW